MWQEEHWRARWARMQGSTGRGRAALVAGVILVLLLLAIATSIRGLRERLRADSHGTPTPSSSDPVTVPQVGGGPTTH